MIVSIFAATHPSHFIIEHYRNVLYPGSCVKLFPSNAVLMLIIHSVVDLDDSVFLRTCGNTEETCFNV